MKTTLMLAVAGIVGLVLSQGQGQAQSGGKGFDLSATVTSANAKTRISDLTPSLQALAASVYELQDAVAGLKKENAALRAALNKTNSSLETVKAGLAVPDGYTATWMSRANLDRVKGNELMRFHVQIVTPKR